MNIVEKVKGKWDGLGFSVCKRAFVSKPLPLPEVKPGQIYRLGARDGNPFDTDPLMLVQVKAVREGWVNYMFCPHAGIFSNWSMNIKTFLECYSLHQDVPAEKPKALPSNIDELRRLLALEMKVDPQDLSDKMIRKLITIGKAFFLDPDLEKKVIDLAEEIDDELCAYAFNEAESERNAEPQYPCNRCRCMPCRCAELDVVDT